MANADWNFDGNIDSSDDYVIDILCVDHSFIRNESNQGREEFCDDYTLQPSVFTAIVDSYQIDRITPYFPTSMPIDAIDEGQGLGYYVVNNTCISVWGNECVPQQQAHFVQNHAVISEYIPPTSPWQIMGVGIAIFIAYLIIKQFAIRGGHA